MGASSNPVVSAPRFKHDVNSSSGFCAIGSPPVFYISAGMASESGAFPQDSCLVAFTTSWIVGGLPMVKFIYICGC